MSFEIMFFFEQETAYEMRISDWSSDVCSSDLSARRRIWNASPYFVPDEQIVSALELARLRGVEVRILLPEKPDQLLVYLASYGYYAMAERAGIEIYRYQPGFLHQKVLLVDDDIVSIGTANLDNRSFRSSEEHTSELQSLMRISY